MPARVELTLTDAQEDHMKVRSRALAALAVMMVLAVASVALTACGGSGPGAAVVPTLGNATSTTAATGPARTAALAAAAQCIRQHGIPTYQDPVLTQSGHVYTDTRSLQNAAASAVQTVHTACAALLRRAGLTISANPQAEPPAPPQLVQAGVRAAECDRANGLPNMRDPSSQTPYVPGHGFQLTGNEIPTGGKASPAFQRASHACRSLLDAEIRASTLSSLAGDG
jgi:hypothetical protein